MYKKTTGNDQIQNIPVSDIRISSYHARRREIVDNRRWLTSRQLHYLLQYHQYDTQQEVIRQAAFAVEELRIKHQACQFSTSQQTTVSLK
jgi:hypothetical protein